MKFCYVLSTKNNFWKKLRSKWLSVTIEMVIVFNHHPDNFMAIDCFFKGTIGWMDSRTTFKTIGGLDDHDPLVTNYTNSCLGHAIWIAKLWEREPKSKMGKQQWWTVNQQTCDNYQVNMVCKWQLILVMCVGQTCQKRVLFLLSSPLNGDFCLMFLRFFRGVGFNPLEKNWGTVWSIRIANCECIALITFLIFLISPRNGKSMIYSWFPS